MKEIIKLVNISCKVGNNFLLRDINWQVNPGEHWVVFGMNGSGKTTLLSIVAGFKGYTSGHLEIFGKEMNNETILALRKRIGWVSASFFDKYYSKEAVMDIVLSAKFGTLGIAGEITVADRRRAEQLLTELGLGRRSAYAFDMLSKGERQNVLIARALFTNPDILILDEPCTGLDVYNREYLFQTLGKLAQIKTLTIIYVTHYVEEIQPMFDQCLLLKNGYIFAAGRTEEALNSTLLSRFLDHTVSLNKDGEQMHLSVRDIQSQLIRLLE